MKDLITRAIHNSPAMNMLMITVLVLGAISGMSLHREEFPQFDLEMILVTVPYPGASPEEVETGICQKIEESIRSIEGIKKITSVAMEGAGNIVIELNTNIPDIQKTLGEVESAVDRIPSFPLLSEEPDIQQVTMRRTAISVGIVAEETNAPDAALKLREITEQTREDILQVPSISVAEIAGSKDFQIDVEISETTLRKYGLTLQQVANIIRSQNVELPGGNLKTDSQEFLLRGKNKRETGAEIRKIPLLTTENKVSLTVGEIGTVRDEFTDGTAISRINGKPGLVINVQASDDEDLLQMTDDVRKFTAETRLPEGYSYVLWGDTSINVRERLDLLQRNGMQGLLLVFLVLALFLELKLAFWVALGIPVSILGACGVLMYFGQTMNMLSMFAFLIALGIVVDDAIVIGENIYAHRELGKPYLKAAIDGTVEVVPSVVASICTTVIAFMPMFFVTGVMGKFFAVLPLAVIAMLVISLLESTFILPCHLAHGSRDEESLTLAQRATNWRTKASPMVANSLGILLVALGWVFDIFLYPFKKIAAVVGLLSRAFSGLLTQLISKIYLPGLRWSLKNPGVPIAMAMALLMVAVAFVRSGQVPWVFFPKMDAPQIQGEVVFPNGTPSHITERAITKISDALQRVNQKYSGDGKPIVQFAWEMVGQTSSDQPGQVNESVSGSQVGMVKVELIDNTKRSITSQQFINEWREEVGNIAGAESLVFGTQGGGPGGSPIEFKLMAGHGSMEELETAVEEVKQRLAEYPGVFDIVDDSRPGKWEYQLTVKEEAKSLGVPLQVLAGNVRSAYYGEEVMRLQRGRHEVKLMVRYPPAERHSLADFQNLRVDSGDGTKRPLTELANINVTRGYAEINRLNQLRSITVTADVNEQTANASRIVADLQNKFMPGLLKEHPSVRVRWEGQQEQTKESVESLMVGFAIALVAMFVLLTLQFSSYLQPLIIMAIIPFGLIGAILGHLLLGLPLTLFSVLGLVALTGVLVNDSIVLVDFINDRYRSGMNLEDALLEAGERRFRPVLLTSMTTIAGLLPILTETSFQAQILIPMATSLSFGLMLSTALVLYLVPVFYLIYRRWIHAEPHTPTDDDSPTELEPTEQTLPTQKESRTLKPSEKQPEQMVPTTLIHESGG